MSPEWLAGNVYVTASYARSSSRRDSEAERLQIEICFAAEMTCEPAKRGGAAFFVTLLSETAASRWVCSDCRASSTATKNERLSTRSAKWMPSLHSSVVARSSPGERENEEMGLLVFRASCLQVGYRLAIAWNYVKQLAQYHRRDL